MAASSPLAVSHHPDAHRPGPDALVVRAHGLSRAHDGRGVLAGVDLEIGKGEFVVLLGRAGSGKSTLLRILSRLDSSFTGELQVPERPAVAFQDPRLLPWSRVIDNVMLGHTGPEARGRAARLLGEVGLSGRGHAWPKELSGGEAQRVALARTLMGEPELVLLDEPFGALDALTRIRLNRLLRALVSRYQPGVLLVTHDIDEALLLADRILVLTAGTLTLDLAVDLPPRGRQSHPTFVATRDRILHQLQLDEDEPWLRGEQVRAPAGESLWS